jgi:hypothetical protein
MSPKIGAEAAELEYTIWVDRLWISLASLPTFVMIVLAIKLRDWVFGGIAIAGYAVMILLFFRMFVLRHRFYMAVSSALGFHVSLRHPPRGVPNWRRRLNERQLDKLEGIYDRWLESKRSEIGDLSPRSG